jgi:hypothetical protein
MQYCCNITDSYSSADFTATDNSVNDNGATENDNVKAKLRKTAAPAAVDISKLSKEMTFAVFENQIWPRMLISDKQSSLHASLVHTEIRSVIKGSSDSLANAGIALHYTMML